MTEETKAAQVLAAKIIKEANDGYHRRDDYPPYALTSWDDRPRWSAYIEKVAAKVIAEHLDQAKGGQS